MTVAQDLFAAATLADIRQLPRRAGIYVVVGPEKRVLYVGQAQDLRQRWSGHHRKQQARRVQGAKPAYILCDAADLSALEKEYIGNLHPEWNGQRIPWEPMAHPDNASIAAAAIALQDLFGQRLVATIAGVRDPKAVGRWASGRDIPREEAAAAILNAMRIIDILRTQETDETVRSWFRGMNPALGDRAPALLIRDQPESVAQAARAFLAR